MPLTFYTLLHENDQLRMYCRAIFATLAALILLATPCLSQAQAPSANLLTNPGFEAGKDKAAAPGWYDIWTRADGAGKEDVDSAVRHNGSASLHVTHHGNLDWSVAQSVQLKVTPGDIYETGSWVKCDKDSADTDNLPSQVTISVVARKQDDSVIDWEYGRIDAGGQHDWMRYSRRIVIPPDCASIRFRFTGSGPASAWFDDASLIKVGTVSGFAPHKPLGIRQLANPFLKVWIDGSTGALTVMSKRGGAKWVQQQVDRNVVVTGIRPVSSREISLSQLDIANALPLTATITLAANEPRIAMTLHADPSIQVTSFIAYPHPFVSSAGSWLIVPLNEGIAFPVDDQSVTPLGQLVAYGGHGICMPWWGATTSASDKGGAGVQSIIGTPDDAQIEIARTDRDRKSLYARPLWEARRGVFGYDRSITYVFSDKGGYVAQAKQYRRWSQAHGLFKTLAAKRRENANVDWLIGAVNVWNWDMDRVALCTEMQKLGMDKILWSSGGSPDEVKSINAMGLLTSRYDVFQDVWAPGTPGLNTQGWPEDLVWLPSGDFMHGWADIRNENGVKKVYQGGVISSAQGLARAKQQIPEDLAHTPYLCRFLDTTTASPFREDYNPAHPLTRTQDKQYKMALLNFCSHDEHLVVGSETGVDAAVPYVHYFEGMMSLGPYRLPDAGRDMLLYKPPTADFLKYQVGSNYRIPLWELVYHDCVVSDWYWGDYNNKAPEVWERRNLFNILYGTPPMFMFDRAGWEKDKARFAQSYKDICPIVRRLGYDEMLSHSFLTSDHTIQQTRWKSGAIITVNFGDSVYGSGKAAIAPHKWTITSGQSRPE